MLGSVKIPPNNVMDKDPMNLEGENHDPYMHHDTRTREKSEFLMAEFGQDFIENS